MFTRAVLVNILLLLVALLLSIAVGPVFIPPGTFMRIVAGQLPGVSLAMDWPETFQTIVFQIRLPHTLLIAITGAALAAAAPLTRVYSATHWPTRI